jgi:hypothetical protein
VRLRLLSDKRKVKSPHGSVSSLRQLTERVGFGRRECELLFRLANRFHPVTCVSLGSGLGLTPLYLTAYAEDARCLTLETDPQLRAVALRVSKHSSEKIRYYDNPADLLAVANPINLLVVNREISNCGSEFFSQLLLKMSATDGLVVIAEPRRSAAAQAMWQTLSERPDVTVMIDLFSLGIAFFNPKLHRKIYKCALV